jgi:hypothetical protein
LSAVLSTIALAKVESLLKADVILLFDVYCMKDFFEKNKVPLTIIVAAFLIATSIWLSRLAGGSPRWTKRPAPVRPQNVIDRQTAPLQLPKTSEPPQLPKIAEKLSFLMRRTVEVCKKSRLYSIFKAKSLDFGGISNKIRKKTLDYCNLRKILILLQNWKACSSFVVSCFVAYFHPL